MPKKVSLRWLQQSDVELAKSFRVAISQEANECALCCMFFEDDYIDSEGNQSRCKFEEIDVSEIEHFQQMATSFNYDIKIVQLELMPEEHRTLKSDIETFVVS